MTGLLGRLFAIALLGPVSCLDQGHGWREAENRIDFRTHVETFLDTNLH